ncbi:thioredoxin domain-containing protein [Luteolibacter arcticus]|uniref:Thioredoxin domain-containing protein n=1 Tax=Luteolibacter arcticus TaxID=1581411 RepID=A0ABT3GJB1_9BACT|nr:vitamin K epoxide reductase family protein [Luteolibacter arcticus]MCW1923594.1 thioredoxin domain-containing protein [Luteolibacter arcticus]
MLALRLVSMVGLFLSAWLLFQKATGSITYLVGCGAASGCANVLGSRWSQWFLVPVSALSLSLYAALLVLTFKPHRSALAAVATCLLGAAAWFAIVQAFLLRSFCPWCLAAHLIGLTAAVLVWRADKEVWPGSSKHGALAGLAALSVLIAGQVFGPAPASHAVSEITLAASPPDTGATKPVHSRGAGRKVTFLGNKEYNVAALPHLGDPAAPHVVVKYYDYACDVCRDLHEDLLAFERKHPRTLCVVLLPCPIERACNPNVPAHVKDHAHACDLARLALACWRTDPESFPAVHHALFARPVQDLPRAMTAVTTLMGKPLAPDALQDPWIAEILAADAADYQRVNVTNSGELNYLMPKLLVGGTRMLHGKTRSREILFQALEHEFKLAPQ